MGYMPMQRKEAIVHGKWGGANLHFISGVI